MSVVTTYPYIATIVQEIGKEHIHTETLAQGGWDPHFVVPKPSLIGKLRNADAIILNGADLEIGWLPPLVERANNSRLNQDANRLDLSKQVKLIDVPANISRAGGDVHADGNPHFHLDPNNIPILAEAIAMFLSQKDPANAKQYSNNLATLKAKWQKHLTRWEKQMQPYQGKKVVQYHPVFNYFLRAYDIKSIGTIEPLAGIPPSSSHTMKLIGQMQAAKPFCIMHDVYHPLKTGEYIAQKTGVKLVVVPHDVGAGAGEAGLSNLFDTIIGKLE